MGIRRRRSRRATRRWRGASDSRCAMPMKRTTTRISIPDKQSKTTRSRAPCPRASVPRSWSSITSCRRGGSATSSARPAPRCSIARVIVEIFHRHAKSREARLQVEIARLTYVAPRLREAGAGGDRQRGGIGGKGAGESALELDRRQDPRPHRRAARELGGDPARAGDAPAHRGSDQRRVALVGYTNAGKIVADARAHRQRGVRRRQALRDARHDGARARTRRPSRGSWSATRSASSRSCRTSSSRRFARRSTRRSRRRCCCTWSTRRTRRSASQLEVTREVLAEIGAGEVPSRLRAQQARPTRRREAQRALAARVPGRDLISAQGRTRRRGACASTIVAFFDGELVEAGAVRAVRGARDREASTTTATVLAEATRRRRHGVHGEGTAGGAAAAARAGRRCG